jgi:hypothetical protein
MSASESGHSEKRITALLETDITSESSNGAAGMSPAWGGSARQELPDAKRARFRQDGFGPLSWTVDGLG